MGWLTNFVKGTVSNVSNAVSKATSSVSSVVSKAKSAVSSVVSKASTLTNSVIGNVTQTLQGVQDSALSGVKQLFNDIGEKTGAKKKLEDMGISQAATAFVESGGSIKEAGRAFVKKNAENYAALFGAVTKLTGEVGKEAIKIDSAIKGEDEDTLKARLELADASISLAAEGVRSDIETGLTIIGTTVSDKASAVATTMLGANDVAKRLATGDIVGGITDGINLIGNSYASYKNDKAEAQELFSRLKEANDEVRSVIKEGQKEIREVTDVLSRLNEDTSASATVDNVANTPVLSMPVASPLTTYASAKVVGDVREAAEQQIRPAGLFTRFFNWLKNLFNKLFNKKQTNDSLKTRLQVV